MQGVLYDVAGWTIYLPEVVICSLFIMGFTWLNSKGDALSGQFQYFAVALMIVARRPLSLLPRGSMLALIPFRSWRASLISLRGRLLGFCCGE